VRITSVTDRRTDGQNYDSKQQRTSRALKRGEMHTLAGGQRNYTYAPFRLNPDSLLTEADSCFRNQSTSTYMSPPTGPLPQTLPVFLVESRVICRGQARQPIGPVRPLGLIVPRSPAVRSRRPSAAASCHLRAPLLCSSRRCPTGHQRSIAEKDALQM